MRLVPALQLRRPRILGSLSTIFLSIVALIQTASGQSSPSPPQPAPPTSADQEQFISYWTTETSWTSELQLRNNAVSQDITVTPVLRLAGGAETRLASVTIKPQEVKSVDLETAITAASAPQLIGTFGSVVLRFLSPSSGALYAAMMIRQTGHAVAFHIDAKGVSPGFQLGSREGVWWLPKDTTSDYLILTNRDMNALTLSLSLYDASGKESKQKLQLGPGQTTRYSIRQLVFAAGLAGTYGGIKLSATAHAGSLDTLHFLFDETADFSALLKMFDHDPNAEVGERTLDDSAPWSSHAPMLALSSPDPTLAFPPGTILRPQLFIRNTIGKPVDVALRFSWRAATTTGKASGPALHLNPYETRRIDMAAFQDGHTLPKQANWTSVTLTTNGQPDDVMAVAASYDATLRYGAQTPFSDQLSFKWEGGMWEFDAYHDSIMTAGNGGAKPTQAAFTIFYNQGTQRYDLEQTLQPEEQMWIDVGKLIREHVPDKNGNVLPPDLSSGSYEFRDLTDFALGSLFEGKVIYDKAYGHVAYGCANCCGTTATQLWLNPLGVPLSATAGQGVNGYDNCALTWSDVSPYFDNNWHTGSTSIATADYYGTHTGVSVGSTTSATSGLLRQGSNGLLCPRKTFTPGGNLKVMALSCSPSAVTRGNNATCSVSNAPSGATFSSWKFTDSNNNTVSRGGNNNVGSWSGTIVTGGTIQVTAGSIILSASITITARSSFAFAAVSPTPEPNNSSPGPGCTLSVPSPPYLNSLLGLSCLVQASYFTDVAVSDSGPNQGYHYVTTVTNVYQGTPTGFYYVISPDLSNTASSFYKAQTGTYNAQTNPNGYISGSSLLADAIRHESGTLTSHYQNYVTAQNNSGYNVGVVAESEIGLPSQTQANFETKVQGDVTAAKNTIQSQENMEPCNSKYVGYDATCTFQGYVNYTF